MTLKDVDTTRLAIHCAATASPIALLLIEFGNISDSMTQATGPQDSAKPAIYTTTATRAASPTLCALNRQPNAIMAAAMMKAPVTSSGLRPHLSTVTMAMTVKITLALPTTTVCNIAVSVVAPMLENI